MYFRDLENGERFVVDGDSFIRVNGAHFPDDAPKNVNAIGIDGSLYNFRDDDVVTPNEPEQPEIKYAQRAEIPMQYFHAFLDALLQSDYQCLCTFDCESNVVIIEYLNPEFCGSSFEETPF